VAALLVPTMNAFCAEKTATSLPCHPADADPAGIGVFTQAVAADAGAAIINAASRIPVTSFISTPPVICPPLGAVVDGPSYLPLERPARLKIPESGRATSDGLRSPPDGLRLDRVPALPTVACGRPNASANSRPPPRLLSA